MRCITLVRPFVRGLALITAIGPLAAPAQDAPASPCKDPVPRMGDGLAYYDKLGVLYRRLDSTFLGALAGRSALLDTNAGDSLTALRERMDSTFARIARSQTSRAGVSVLWRDLGKYEAFVIRGFSSAGAPQPLQERLCPLRVAYLAQTVDAVAEHSRKMAVRYGAGSERLNIAEMLLNELTTSHAPTGALRDPSHWEWILRTQVLGYQYNRATRELEASFPVSELGLTYYLYGSSAIERRLHHIGVAAAYQRDVKRKRDLVGVVMHVQQFDVGVLCASSCRQHVIVASKNFSLFSNTWNDMRKALDR